MGEESFGVIGNLTPNPFPRGKGNNRGGGDRLGLNTSRMGSGKDEGEFLFDQAALDGFAEAPYFGVD